MVSTRKIVTERECPGWATASRADHNAEYSPALALWLVRLSACRSPGYGGPEGSHACASCHASTSRKKTRTVPRGGRAAARLHRQPIPRALTTPRAGSRKRSIAVQETGRCGCADGSVVTGAPARRPRSRADPRRPRRRRAAEGTQHGGLASVRRHAPDASIKQQPGHPAARRTRPAPRRRSPTQARSQERSSASPGV